MDQSTSQIDRALGLEDPTEQMLSVAALITEAVRDLGYVPVVVGGLAVQFWTYGEYMTYDIDLLLPSTPEVDERLGRLGFVKEGRHWVIPGRDVFVEAPGSFLGPDEEAEEVQLPMGTVRLLRPEDVLIYLPARIRRHGSSGRGVAGGQPLPLERHRS